MVRQIGFVLIHYVTPFMGIVLLYFAATYLVRYEAELVRR